MSLTIHQATPDDLVALTALQADSVAWLAAKGLDQWQSGQPRAPRDRPGSHLTDSIDEHTCWIVDSDTEALATIIVDDKADPEFWSPAEANEALYVHRMIVKRSLAGHDLGAVLLDWADELAGQARRHWLRLDAWRTNTALHDYYRHQGFAHVRTVDLAHRGSGALFQRKISQNRQHANFHISTDGTSAEIALPAGSETRPWG